jgi:hypothetical protein
MKIYVETSCLRSNIARHSDIKSQRELAALEQIADQYLMLASRLTLREAMDTRNAPRRENLIIDHKALQPISKDEKLLGFNSQSDPYCGFICYPIIQDCQLVAAGLGPKDAEPLFRQSLMTVRCF